MTSARHTATSPLVDKLPAASLNYSLVIVLATCCTEHVLAPRSSEDGNNVERIVAHRHTLARTVLSIMLFGPGVFDVALADYRSDSYHDQGRDSYNSAVKDSDSYRDLYRDGGWAWYKSATKGSDFYRGQDRDGGWARYRSATKGSDSYRNQQKSVMKAPEIDAGAGVKAIALLSGNLLLARERSQRRRKG